MFTGGSRLQRDGNGVVLGQRGHNAGFALVGVADHGKHGGFHYSSWSCSARCIRISGGVVIGVLTTILSSSVRSANRSHWLS